ncbi:MAG: (Fe-S)-binding protein, partial [Deltaproteobacteria bacterium]|nr:(Fe-S)-binding protein [Deltaproteobacteria bacterium]
PCYLGRHSGDYQSPRMILSALPNVTLVEMERNRKNALCCGGGGGNIHTDILGSGDEKPAVHRVREAGQAGVEILAVACPLCAIMLEDAIKTSGLEGRLQVCEISKYRKS